MTWDASRLYVAIANANLSEAAVMYIDANPVNPPNAGTSANGNLTGFNYDGEEIGTLPFRARFVTYFKDGNNEYRNSDGNGNWTNPVSNYGAYASIGNVREFAIPWPAITGGGIPSSFLFLGLLTSSGGYVYGQAPNDNGGGNVGTSAVYSQYFVVNSTTNGSSTPPFSIENPPVITQGIPAAHVYHNHMPNFWPYYANSNSDVITKYMVCQLERPSTIHTTATSLI